MKEHLNSLFSQNLKNKNMLELYKTIILHFYSCLTIWATYIIQKIRCGGINSIRSFHTEY